MTVREALPESVRHDIRILATDLDSDVLARARNGVYGEDRMKGLSAERCGDSSASSATAASSTTGSAPDLQRADHFQPAEPDEPAAHEGAAGCDFLPQHGHLFRQGHAAGPVQALSHNCSVPGTSLFLGHSESMFKVSDDYKLMGRTIYRRNAS